MTEEIKEILDRIKNYPEKLYCLNETEKSILLDYITNLQQLYENGLKVNQNSHKYITELEMNNTILKEDLDKANDIIEKDRQFYKCRMDEYVELKKENESNINRIHELEQEIDSEYVQKENYKSRFEKAKEYIEKNQERKTYYGGICDGEDYYILHNSDELLNILNGVDENE